MHFYVIYSDSLLWILVKHLMEQILALTADNVGYFQLLFGNAFVKLLDIERVKWSDSYYQFIKNCSKLVDVRLLSNSLISKHLWRYVGWTPAKRVSFCVT